VELPALGDVVLHADQPPRSSFVVANRHGSDGHPTEVSVGMLQAMFVREVVVGRAKELVEIAEQPRAVERMDQGKPLVAMRNRRLAGAAEHFVPASRGEESMRIETPIPNAFLRAESR
jgi:hypothetical protein